MNVQLPCRWEERPQVWQAVLYRLLWLDRHMRAIRLPVHLEQQWTRTIRATHVDLVRFDHAQP